MCGRGLGLRVNEPLAHVAPLLPLPLLPSQSLSSYIDSTEDLINLELDQQRNNLIRWGLSHWDRDKAAGQCCRLLFPRFVEATP